MRCQHRGERKVMKMGRWWTEAYRCEADGTEVYDATGERLCGKHLRLAFRREIAAAKDLLRTYRRQEVNA